MEEMLMEVHPFDQKYSTYRKDNLHFRYGLLFQPRHARSLMSRLEEEVRYSDPEHCMIQVYGKWYHLPRRQASFASPSLSYEYSGKKVESQDWTPFMKELLEVVNKVCGQSYNYVLVNRYRDGKDKIGFHSDDEKSLDKTVPIASLSFGAARDFVFRNKFDQSKQVKLCLEPGSILLMEHPTNDYWHHSLPPCKTCKTPRVNLTFRKIK